LPVPWKCLSKKLLTKSVDVTQHRLAKTLTPQHIKECVKLEPTFRFLHGVVATVPDLGSEGNSGQSTITSNQGSADSYFGAATGTSTSQRAIGPKRRGSKYVSLGESSTSSQDGPPIKTARRGRKPKLSVELDQDFGDLSDADDDISGEDSGDKTYHRKSSTKTAPKQQRRRAKEEVYELGPTASDDVPDDPSTS